MINLKDYGYTGDPKGPGGLVPVRITAVHRERSIAISEMGELGLRLSGAYQNNITARSDLPAVGDYALVRYNPHGDSLIERILPRNTQFSRLDQLGSHASRYETLSFEQVVAANFDYVFIISSLNQDFKAARIARYLTAAYESGATPVVVLTKVDLCEDPAEYIIAAENAAPGVPVIALSSHTREGLSLLDPYLKPGKTLVFLGMSGVGKSSLLNALSGEELMAVKAIREDDARGRHTTTHRELFRLPSGVLVIDTPGMRELGFWDAEEGLQSAFADVEALFNHCRFADCAHQKEPGCAVQRALQDGSLDPKRWGTYQAQQKEIAYAANRTQYLHDRTQKRKEISKFTRKLK